MMKKNSKKNKSLGNKAKNNKVNKVIEMKEHTKKINNFDTVENIENIENIETAEDIKNIKYNENTDDFGVMQNSNELFTEDEHILNNDDVLDNYDYDDGESKLKQFDKRSNDKKELVIKRRAEREQKKLKNTQMRKLYNKKYAVFALISVIIIVLAVSLYSAANKKINNNREELSIVSSFDISASGKYAFAPYKNGILAADTENISYYTSALKSEWSQPAVYGSPVAFSSGMHALVCYKDTGDAFVVSGNDINHITLTGNVTGGDINNDGTAAIIAAEDGYKSQIAVYSKDGDLMYKWHSADNYVTDVAVSNDGKSMIAATLDFSDGIVSGGLLFFNFSQDKPYAGVVLENNAIAEVKYLSNSRIAAIGDEKAVIYNIKGTEVNTIDYKNMKLLTYDFDTDGNIALCFSRDDSVMSNCDTVIYNKNGKEKGRYSVKGNIKTVNKTNDRTLAVLDREIIILSDSGEQIKKIPVTRDIRNAILLDGGKSAFVVSGTVAQTVKLN